MERSGRLGSLRRTDILFCKSINEEIMKKLFIAIMATLAAFTGAQAQQKGAIELKLWEQGSKCDSF